MSMETKITRSLYEEISAFMQAQDEAEKANKQEFQCPLCGGVAVWGRSSYNNHLHCVCKGCGFRMME